MRVRFAEFCIDTDRRQLTCDLEAVHLTPKAFDLLAHLVEHRPRAIAQDDLFDHLWPDTLVDTSRIHQLIQEIRAALHDKQRRVIRTVYGRGYSFAASAVDLDAPPPSLCRLIVGIVTYELREGENLIGRDYRASIRIDSPSISRRHAMILVERDRATMEDLESRNGTFVGGRRVRSATPLNTGDSITFGRVQALFEIADPPGSTESAS